MKNQQSCTVLFLTLLQCICVEAGFYHYIRGALPKHHAAIEDYMTILFSIDEEDQDTASQSNETEGRQRNLQAPTNLVLSSSFMSRIDKTYVFPEALNPDCAAGQDMVIGVSQLSIEGINRVTHERIFSNSLRYLFQTLEGDLELMPRTASMISPRVVYDNTGRFIVATTMTDQESFSKLHFAVSKTSNPQSGLAQDWNLVVVNIMDMVGTENVWAKDISLAVSEDSIYVTATMYSTDVEEDTNNFVESRLFIINKMNFYSAAANPNAQAAAVAGTLQGYSQNIFANVMALDLDGNKLGPYVPAPTSSGAYMVAYNDQSLSDLEELHVVEITDSLNTFGVISHIVALGEIDLEGLGPLPGGSQPNPDYAMIETGNRRVNDAVFVGNMLHVATTVEDAQGETAVFWAKIDTSSSPMTISESGLMNGEAIAPGTSTFFPSIVVSNAGDMVVGYGASGPSVFAGMYVSATTTTVAQSYVEIKEGEDNYESLDGLAYHGHYSGLSADLVDTNCYWALNTFARVNDPFLWQTWERGALGIQWGKVCLS